MQVRAEKARLGALRHTNTPRSKRKRISLNPPNPLLATLNFYTMTSTASFTPKASFSNTRPREEKPLVYDDSTAPP